jgi:alcohol dehydrogenase class IV
LNIPSFKNLGIKESHFPEIAQKTFENNSNPSNPREAGVEDYLAILKNAVSES